MVQTGVYGPIFPVDASVYQAGTIELEESASYAGERGTPVVIDANGRVDEAATTPTSLYGISLSEGNNGSAGANKCQVFPIKKGSRWSIVLDGTLALTDLGTAVGILKDATTGYWYAAVADSGDQVFIHGIAPGWDVGDTKARVIVEFLDTNLQQA